MSKTAFLFPGQGAQYIGMGQEFYQKSDKSRKVYELASKVLRLDVPALCFEENDKLNLTEYTQAAMVTTSLAILEEVTAAGIVPCTTAGLSLGEYCAVAAAGYMSYEDTIRVVRKRGILMQDAVPPGEGAMAAVLLLDSEKIEEVLRDFEDVWIANYNCPGQIVITGRAEGVVNAREALLNAGAKRVISLNVSGPFHSPLLKEAGTKLEEVLNTVAVKEGNCPYLSNVTADYVGSPAEIKPLLVKQIFSPVRWQQSIERMLADGVDTFVEIGPGRSLSALVKKIDRKVTVLNIEKPEDIEEVALIVNR